MADETNEPGQDNNKPVGEPVTPPTQPAAEPVKPVEQPPKDGGEPAEGGDDSIDDILKEIEDEKVKNAEKVKADATDAAKKAVTEQTLTKGQVAKLMARRETELTEQITKSVKDEFNNRLAEITQNFEGKLEELGGQRQGLVKTPKSPFSDKPKDTSKEDEAEMAEMQQMGIPVNKL